jgi:glycosyltransferase involved in cell wall biosynthesis
MLKIQNTNTIKLPISVIILTFNEEENITHSISNVITWADEVIVLDSGSTDATCKIAENLGANVFYRKFDNYGSQRNYAIKELPSKNEWILFLDADEYLTEELKNEITALYKHDDINTYSGFYLKRRFYFMNRLIKYGGYYPIWILRLFVKGQSTVDREMNEHVSVEGKLGYFKKDFVDNNRKDFAFWLEKHNKYSTYEALELLKEETKDGKDFADLWGSQAQRKRWIRANIWNKLPLFVRPFLYFFYRYFLRLGFLDGVEGFIFHFNHALVFYINVDAKYLQMKKKLYNQ